MTAKVARLALFCVACGAGFDDDFASHPGPSNADCPASLTPHDIQGSTSRSPFEGQLVEVRGVVTLELESEREPGPGFFVQSLDVDADAQSSEGLFVAQLMGKLPAPGTLVRVRGRVAEVAGMTQLSAVERLDECGRAQVLAAPLELRHLDAAEAWEGMWVQASADWAVLDTARAGEVLASPHGRLYASGHELGREAAQAEPWLIRSGARTPSAPPRLDGTLQTITGILHVEGETRRLHTPADLSWSSAVPAVPARTRASSLRIVALNLDNYFLNFKGPGAGSEPELLRQRDRLVATLRALDADILALTELENQGNAPLAHLLEGLNAGLTAERRYDFSATLPPAGASLRAGIAFRSARVEVRREAWFDERPGFQRAPLLQSFESEGRRFTLGVVHFKSKRCDAGPQIIASEGCGELARRAEAELLVELVRSIEGQDPATPLLVMGDYNSDAREAPMVILEGAGSSDLLEALPARERYSYVFEGRASLLDHALAWDGFDALTDRVAIWHINADELPRGDAALDGAAPARPSAARRSSDHDPIVVDLQE